MTEPADERRGASGAERDDPDAEAPDEGAVLREYRRVMYSYAFIGIEFGVAVALGYFGGSWLDKQWDTSPWMMLLGVALGLAAAGKDFVRLIKRAQRMAKGETTEAGKEEEKEKGNKG